MASRAFRLASSEACAPMASLFYFFGGGGKTHMPERVNVTKRLDGCGRECHEERSLRESENEGKRRGVPNEFDQHKPAIAQGLHLFHLAAGGSLSTCEQVSCLRS
jgi:hypothetical protein